MLNACDMASSMFSPAKTLPYRRKLSEMGRNAMETTSMKPTSEKDHDHHVFQEARRLALGAEDMQDETLRCRCDCSAQINQSTIKMADMAKVMFRSALPPRNSGRVHLKAIRRLMPPADRADAREQTKPIGEENEDENGGEKPKRLPNQFGPDDFLPGNRTSSRPATPRNSARRPGRPSSGGGNAGKND